MKKINPCLWFDNNAEEAVNFYLGIFNKARILSVARYGDEGPGEKDSVMAINFELNGQEFMALNGGPYFSFTPAISFFVNCETQAEVDHLWESLSEDGSTEQCGWLKDKYGISWQIVPTVLGELLDNKDAEKSARVMRAMLKMEKLDIEKLTQAFLDG